MSLERFSQAISTWEVRERSERHVRFASKHASECPRHCGGFMGSRRCRRPIAGLCDWGAGELLVGVVPYWMSLSSYEATMSLSEQVL